jgi:hypothetical protein
VPGQEKLPAWTAGLYQTIRSNLDDLTLPKQGDER